MADRPPRLEEQMVADWAAVGLRRLEAHLASYAAFCEFLRARRAADGEDGEACPPKRDP